MKNNRLFSMSWLALSAFVMPLLAPSSAQANKPTIIAECSPVDCDDGDPSTLDFCGSAGCQHLSVATHYWVFGREGGCASSDSTATVPFEHPRCHTKFPGALNPITLGYCFQNRCGVPVKGTRDPKKPCHKDLECQDASTETLNWCEAGKCKSVDRNDLNCFNEQSLYMCFENSECDDQDPTTVDWCNDYGECNSIPRSNNSGQCEAQPWPCETNWECGDGDPSTKNWCHENTCRSVQKDDTSCTSLGVSCQRNRDCRGVKGNTKDTVAWCHQGECRVAPRDVKNNVCKDDELGNIKPDY